VLPWGSAQVSNLLGRIPGKGYERAWLRELGLRGIRATAQASFAIRYQGHYIGEYNAGILVEDVLVVELKCVERLALERTAWAVPLVTEPMPSPALFRAIHMESCESGTRGSGADEGVRL
jgi:PD-(D/E)XK nuclease superfamily protein